MMEKTSEQNLYWVVEGKQVQKIMPPSELFSQSILVLLSEISLSTLFFVKAIV